MIVLALSAVTGYLVAAFFFALYLHDSKENRNAH